MPFTRTKPSRNPGTANCSRSLTSSSDKVSKSKLPKISRFFAKLPKEEMSGDSESPYQNCLKQVKCASLSDSGDLDDFRTPTAIKKVSKIAKVPKNVKTKRKPSDKAPIRKFLEDNFKNSDVNGDHLQMALALSESSYEAENRNEGPSSQEKMDNFKKTLEKYGFGYGKKAGSGYKKDFYSIVASKPRNTRSRYRFVTPILKMRTSEERDALISSKVSLILAQNNRFADYNIQKEPLKLYCESLQDYHGRKIFKINNLSLEELNQDLFYCKGLPVEACAAPCGYLLKDWGQIPGRDISPARKHDQAEEKSSSQSQSAILLKNATPQRQSPVYVYDGSVSPDLFASDDESDRGQLGPLDLNQSDGENQSKNTKKPVCSPQSKKSDSEDMEIVECYDLTQSSDEDIRNVSEDQVEDVKILEKKDMKNRGSEDKAAHRNCTQSEKQNEDESLKKSEKINVSENLQSPEHKSQSPEKTLVYSLSENDYQFLDDKHQFQSPELTNRFDSSENEHLSPLGKYKNPEGEYPPHQSPEPDLRHCKTEKNCGKLLEFEILSISSSEDSRQEDGRRNSAGGKSSKFSEHHSPEYDWHHDLKNEFESPENEHLSSLSKCKNPEGEYPPYQSPEPGLRHCKTEKNCGKLLEVEILSISSSDDSHKDDERRNSAGGTSSKLSEHHSPDCDWQLERENEFESPEIDHLSSLSNCKNPEREYLPDQSPESKHRKSPEIKNFNLLSPVDDSHTIGEEISNKSFDWQLDTLEYQVSGDISGMEFTNVSPEPNIEAPPETETNSKDVIEENLRDSEPQKKSDEGRHTPEHTYSPEYHFSEKIPFGHVSELERGTSDAPEKGCQSVTNEEHESPDNKESTRKSPEFTDIESIQNKKLTPEHRYEAAEHHRRSPEWQYHSPEYDWQSDPAAFRFSESIKPNNQTFESLEPVSRSETNSKDVIEENLTHRESQKKSDEDRHPPEHMYSPEYEWQSDAFEYQFSAEIPFDHISELERRTSNSPENGCQSVTNEDHESPDNKESTRKSPAWQYHSPEYDWQSDAAAFQFSESLESIKPSNQTFEPPERTNQSPEPFADDWIPSEEMECYNLSEDEAESVRNTEKISTSEDSKLSQESICISDDEVNYSSVFATPHPKKKPRTAPPKDTAPLEDSLNDVLARSVVLKQLETPNTANNGNFVIKTKNITPMANYDEMDTPKIVRELDKFGLKPLKRQRGAKLLKYIYESTHPLVEEGSDDDGRVAKKRRTGSLHFDGVVGDIDEDEWVFERTQSKRVPSCRIPLHIVWHNFVRSNPKIQENILLYEPLQLEVLHSMLKEQGFKFNIQDLLTFLDRKCVTIRTAQGQRHGKKTRP